MSEAERSRLRCFCFFFGDLFRDRERDRLRSVFSTLTRVKEGLCLLESPGDSGLDQNCGRWPREEVEGEEAQAGSRDTFFSSTGSRRERRLKKKTMFNMQHET